VSGLLQRAAEYRANQRKLRLVRAESVDGYDELGGTPDERVAIIEQIDQVINQNRVEIGPDTFRFQAKKRGIGLPILVNLIAILLVAGGGYYMIRTFADRESTVVGEATALTSAEGRLLQALREESDAQLLAKDDEISGIQGRLAQISAEREQLEGSINAQLDSQEEALRLEFESALAVERQRLEGGGLSEAEVERRLAEFQSEQQSEFAVQLDDIRAEAEQELQQREAVLNAQIDDVEQSLADAESERSALEVDLREQELRLTSEFATREAELTEERAAAVDLLAELQNQQEQEQLVLDQIVLYYAGIQSDLTAADFDGALEGTAALRQYLSEGSVAALPTVQRRRRVELFLVESLEARIADERQAASPDVAALAESTAVIAQVTELIAVADSAYGAAEFDNARTLYLAALSEIPAVRVGYDRLVELSDQAEAAESDRVALLVQRGNELYRAGSYQDAGSAYGEALATLPSADTALLSRVLDAGYQLLRTNDLTALRTVQAELETSRSRLADSIDTTAALQSQVAALRSALDAVPTEPVSDPLQEERIAELESDLSNRDETISGRDNQIATLKLSITDLNALLAESRTNSDRLDTTLADRLEAASGLQSQVAGLQSQIATRELDLTDLNTLLAESQAEADRLQREGESFSEYVQFYQEQDDLAEEIVWYQERFATAGTGDSTADGVSPLELLETKLIILRILGSQSIQSQYPDITDQLNVYLDALVVEQRARATQETLGDVNVVLDFLLDDAVSVRAIRPGQIPPALAGTGGEASKFFGLLERLTGPE